MPHELPDPEEIHEEHLRPLLAATSFVAHALQIALGAEYPDAILDEPTLDDWPQDPVHWTAEALVSLLETLRGAIALHETALRHRHGLRHLRVPPPPEPPSERRIHALSRSRQHPKMLHRQTGEQIGRLVEVCQRAPR